MLTRPNEQAAVRRQTKRMTGLRTVIEVLEDRVVPAALLDIDNDIYRLASLPATTVTLTGTSELHLTGTVDPFAGSVVNLNSPDAWLFLDNTLPSTVAATYLGRVRVNDAAAVLNTNVRVVQYGVGTVVIPQGSGFTPLEVFTNGSFGGTSTQLGQYTAYTSANLGAFNQSISSFKLKRGYAVTVAQNSDGTGVSKNYVAQDGDLVVPVLPATLDNSIQFVRVVPWRWTSKKGIAGNIGQQLQTQWYYDWNIDQNSSLDREYVPIRQTRWWPDLNQNWQTRGASEVLGYNEPDQANQANIAVGDAVWSWSDLLGTGLRVGAPAVSDGGLSWLYSFMSQADAQGKRVDFVPVHYYRSHNPADPAGCATQFFNYLKGIYDIVKRPLWVTEWNNGANWTSDADPTAAQQQAAVAAMVNMLETTPFVEHYSIYNWVEDARRVQWDDTAGSLTAAGQTYRDTVSTLAYRQELPDPGTTPDAVYSFDGNALDSSGNGQPSLAIATRSYTAGPVGQAITLDGQNDYVQLSPRLGDSTDFTFAGWVNWNGGANWQRIVDMGWDTSNYLFLTPKSGSGTLRFAIRNGGSEQQLNSTAALPAGVWTHVAVTITGSTGKLFVNGELVATNTAMTINPVDLNTFYNYLGKSQFSADPLFAGSLDDVRIIGHALTDAEIAALALKAQDYGFESPATTTYVYNPGVAPWTYSGAAGNGSGVAANGSAFTVNNSAAPQGTQVAFLQSAASIAQTLTGLEPGRTYQITYAASQRQKVGGQAGQTFDVMIDASTLGSFEPTQSLASYTDFTVGFTAAAASQTLRFVGTNLHGGDNTVLLDRVRVKVTSFAAAPPTIAVQAGTFRNAGFEDATTGTGWTLTGSAAVGNGNLHTGSRALRMNGAAGTAEQIVTGLMPNTMYTLGGWSRVSLGASDARLGVKNFGGAEQWVSTTSAGYTRTTLTFTTGPTATQATVYLAKPLAGNAADFDDVLFTESPRVFAGTFRNAGFEDTPAGTGWTSTGTAQVVTSNQRTGSRAMLMNGTAGYSEQLVTGLLPNTAYTFGGWSHVSYATIQARLGVKGYGGAELSADTSSTTYTYEAVSFTTGPTATQAIVYVQKALGSNSAVFDDLELTRQSRLSNEDSPVAPISFSVDNATIWSMTATSSDQSLVKDASIVLGGSSAGRTLQATPEPNQSGTMIITVTVTDIYGGTVSYAVPLTILPVNDAPLLDNTGSMNLDPIVEDVIANPGTLVSAIIASAGGDRITDIDAGAAEGIAVFALNSTNGRWQFTTDSGTTWTDFGTVSSTSSRLLASDVATRIRFVPNVNYVGTALLGFRAWDQTAGSNGGTAGTSANGGSTAFSTASETATVTVTAAVPTVDAIIINGGDAQRSRVTTLQVAFNTALNLSLLGTAFTLTRTDGALVGAIAVAAATTNGRTTATLTFSGAFTEYGSLEDGVWVLSIDHAKVQNASGPAMVADYATSTTGTDRIARLFGDSDGDGDVDLTDLFAFRQSFAQAIGATDYNTAFDFDGDGDVDLSDLFEFRSRFGLVLP